MDEAVRFNHDVVHHPDRVSVTRGVAALTSATVSAGNTDINPAQDVFAWIKRNDPTGHIDLIEGVALGTLSSHMCMATLHLWELSEKADALNATNGESEEVDYNCNPQ